MHCSVHDLAYRYHNSGSQIHVNVRQPLGCQRMSPSVRQRRADDLGCGSRNDHQYFVDPNGACVWRLVYGCTCSCPVLEIGAVYSTLACSVPYSTVQYYRPRSPLKRVVDEAVAMEIRYHYRNTVLTGLGVQSAGVAGLACTTVYTSTRTSTVRGAAMDGHERRGQVASPSVSSFFLSKWAVHVSASQRRLAILLRVLLSAKASLVHPVVRALAPRSAGSRNAVA
jgi:hypothetical protein